MHTDTPAPPGRAVALLTLFVAAGVPLVHHLWETINELLAGHVVGRHVALAVPAGLGLALLLALLARAIRRL